MTAITTVPAQAALTRPRARPRGMATWATLARRRIMLSAHTPREVLAPLVTPLLFALVIAPALAKMIPGGGGYATFVIVGTVGLLIPLTCTFAGIGVIVDRASGARRELLAAPISRSLIVLGNMAVAVAVSLLQVTVLIAAGRLRGSHFHATAAGAAWFAGAVLLVHSVHVRGRRDPGQPDSHPGGIRRSHPGRGHLALVPGRIAVPDHRAARLARRRRPGPAHHPHPGPAALRRAQPRRRRPARHLGPAQHHRRCCP